MDYPVVLSVGFFLPLPSLLSPLRVGTRFFFISQCLVDFSMQSSLFPQPLSLFCGPAFSVELSRGRQRFFSIPDPAPSSLAPSFLPNGTFPRSPSSIGPIIYTRRRHTFCEGSTRHVRSSHRPRRCSVFFSTTQCPPTFFVSVLFAFKYFPRPSSPGAV